MKKVGLILVLVLLCSAAGALCDEMAVVDADTANLRADAGTQYEILGKLTKGTMVYILSEEGEWYFVRTQKGETGWIHGKLLSK